MDVNEEKLAQIIAEATKKSQQNIPEPKVVFDWLFRALMGVLVYLGVGLMNRVDSIDKSVGLVGEDVKVLKIESDYEKREMESFKAFVKEPRFTKQDYEDDVQSTKTQVNRNINQLNELRSLIQSNTDGIRETKFITSRNAEAISNILKILEK